MDVGAYNNYNIIVKYIIKYCCNLYKLVQFISPITYLLKMKMLNKFVAYILTNVWFFEISTDASLFF